VKYSDDGIITVNIELYEDNVVQRDSKSADATGSREIRLEVNEFESTDVPFATIRVSIEDTGIGLTEETRAALFQPFKQAQRFAGGTGLGLFSLSKRSEALGGSRGVGNRKDGKRGSLFWFSFPYRPDRSSELQELSPSSESVKLEELSPASIDIDRNLHVLLVDDSFTVIQVVGRSLKQKGYLVTSAKNGSVALDLMRQENEFDFVLMDLQMPVMVGYVCIYVYMYMYIWIHIFTYICICIYGYIYTHICIHICMYDTRICG
jgi:two-component system capsular synthesis sensor histidine kinase RcsC